MKRLALGYKDLELSHATMRPEDLIPCFMSFLQDVSAECDIEQEVNALQEEVDEIQDWNSDDVCILLNEDLWNLLNEIAPRGCYFGAHEGDGSAYGFWFAVEELELIISDMEVTQCQ